MRILVAHNFYQQAGGEDQCFLAETALLRAHGHEVEEFRLHNDAINTMAVATVAARTIWSVPAYRALRDLFRRRRPQIAHFHNTFPLMSPAAYYAARAERVAVVQTMHNFRPICAGATLQRAGEVCESCIGKVVKWPALAHACYRGGRAATAGVVAMQTLHAALGSWRSAVDVYVALTEFSRRKLIAGGLPAHKIFVKPNFAEPDTGAGRGEGGYAVFVGRLVEEKGVATLLEAWRRLNGRVRLKIIGDGPMANVVSEAARSDSAVEWLGPRPLAEVCRLVGAAQFLVAPSLWYEMFPRVVAEAFSKGTPVLASQLGSLAEIVEDGATGLLFTPGDADALAAAALRLASDPVVLQRMRAAARRTYDERFSAPVNYRMLMDVYSHATQGSFSAGSLARPAASPDGAPGDAVGGA